MRGSSWQRHLSSAYRRSGGVLLDLDEVPREQERLSSSRTILEHLLTNEPDSPAFRRLLAATHVGTGAVSLAMGNLRDAREEAQTALAMTEPLFEGDSENRQTRRWLTLSHLLEGNALSRLGEAEQARAAWTRRSTRSNRSLGSPPTRSFSILGPAVFFISIESRRRHRSSRRCERSAIEIRSSSSYAGGRGRFIKYSITECKAHHNNPLASH